MELLYVRILKTDRKTPLAFENKDLNFGGSLRFKFSENEKNDLLELIKEDGYYENIYGENIDATCIVGANGVGKTTLLNFLQWLIATEINKENGFSVNSDTWNWIAVFKYKDMFIVKKSKEYQRKLLTINFDNIIDKDITENRKYKTHSIYYSPHVEFHNSPNFDTPPFINLSTDFLFYQENLNKEEDDTSSELENFRRADIKRQISFVNYITRKRNKSDEESNFFEDFIGDTLYLRFYQWIQYFNTNQPRYIGTKSIKIYQIIEDKFRDRSFQIIDEIKKNKKVRSTASILKPLQSELAQLFFVKRIIEIIYYNVEYRGTKNIKTNEYREDIILNKLDNKDPLGLLKDFISSQKEGHKYINIIKRFEVITQKRRFVYDHLNENFRISLNIGKELIKIEESLKHILPYKTKKEIFSFDWQNMSTGERAYFNLFSRIHYAGTVIVQNKEFNKTEILYFMIDEPATGFHPNWQKSYFKKLIEFIKYRFEEYHNHLLIATHSPFVMSDFQGFDVIGLKKDNEEYSYPLTLGANIHELLADSFFMKDSFMGEFAKQKIEEVILFLNFSKQYIEYLSFINEHTSDYLENSDELNYSKIELKKLIKKLTNNNIEITNKELSIVFAENGISPNKYKDIINIIGEPIIKNKLTDMYNDVFEKSSGNSKKKKQLEKLAQELGAEIKYKK